MTAVNTNNLIISLHRKPLQTGCPVLTGWWKKYRCMCPSNHVINCLLIIDNHHIIHGLWIRHVQCFVLLVCLRACC